MDRYRLIASIVVLFVYMLAMFPWQTITVTVLLLVAYLILRNLHSAGTEMRGDNMRRKMALNEARIYLAPYSDIWRNLKLSNKHCTLRLQGDGKTITARDNNNAGRYFVIKESKLYSYNDLWNLFCTRFSHNTTFDELINLCKIFNTEIDLRGESKSKQINAVASQAAVKVNDKTEKPEINDNKEKLDVNNASEVELTALPGVSIVMAKKLIKKREEIGGFKTVNDVCLFLKLKPHMQNQLEQLICVKKMRGSVRMERYKERKLDL